MAVNPDVKRVGDLLIQEGIITHEEITKALEESGASGALAETLAGCGHVTREALLPVLAENFRVPHLDLEQVELRPSLADLVAMDMATKHELVPVARLGDILCVAKANYFNRAAVADLRRATGLRVKVVQCDEAQLHPAMVKIYGPDAVPAPPVAAPVAPAPAASFMGSSDDALAATIVSDLPAVAPPPPVAPPAEEVVEVEEVQELPPVEIPPAAPESEELPPVEVPAEVAEPVEVEPVEAVVEIEEIKEAPAEEPVLLPEAEDEVLIPAEPVEEVAELVEIPPEAEEAVEVPMIEEVPAAPQAPPPLFAWPDFQAPARPTGNRFKAQVVSTEEVAAVKLALKLDIPAEWEKMYTGGQNLAAIRMAK